MKKTTTQAFKDMIQTHGIHDVLELSSGEVEDIRKKINNHALTNPLKWGLSQDFMSRWLERAGYIRISETLWESQEL